MSGLFSSKHSRFRKYVDRKTGKVFYFDVVAKRSRWRIPRNEITIKTKDEDEDEVVKIFREDVEEGEWYRVEHHLLTRPYWFRNDDSETKERQWEKPLQKAASKEKAGETTEEEESEEEDDDIEFDPDAYENEEGKEQFHQRAAFVAAGTGEAEAEPAFDLPPPPRRATTTPAASAVIIEEKEEEEPKTNNASPKILNASDEIAMNENFNAANKSKALDVFFALCEKAKINEHSRWERDMPKLRKLDKNAFECFATMPERRSAFNKYKVKLSSNAAEKAVGTTKTTKESKLEREKIAREKREREILEKKRDDEYRLKKLKRNQDKGDAMKQFETLLAESIKSIDDVETIDDVRELLSQDPLGRASSGGPLSEADMVASFDAFLLEFKTNSLQRYAELCRETVSALSQSVGGVADEEDAIFAWEIARDVLKEDARFDRCPMKLRRSTFDKAVENFRDERIRNAGTTGASFDAV